jgi:hypothetical protein
MEDGNLGRIVHIVLTLIFLFAVGAVIFLLTERITQALLFTGSVAAWGQVMKEEGHIKARRRFNGQLAEIIEAHSKRN